MKLNVIILILIVFNQVKNSLLKSKVFQILDSSEKERLMSFSHEQIKKHKKINIDLISQMELIKRFRKETEFIEDKDLHYENKSRKIIKLSEASIIQNGNTLILCDEFSPLLQENEILCSQIRYKDELKETGWDQLHIKTNSECDIGIQMWTAGFLEGFVTSYKIQYFFSNLVKQHEEDNKVYIQKVFNFYQDVEANIRKQTANVYNNDNDDNNNNNNKNKNNNENSECLDRVYFQQIGLLQLQADGMLVGYNQNHFIKLSMSDLFFLNGDGQISELIQLFKDNWMKKDKQEMFRLKTLVMQKLNLKRLLFKNKVETVQQLFEKQLRRGHCSVLMKLIRNPDQTIKDLLFSHQTWDDYSQMLRIFKNYEISNTQVTFSSYPGCLSSTDDWYNNKNAQGHILVTETTLEVLNDQVYSYLIGYNQYIPDFMRIVISNRLGYDGKTWTFWMEYLNTGTYNSQWMIMDIKKASSSLSHKQLSPLTFCMFEQMPGDHNIVFKDMSTYLQDNQYYASYNIPFFDQIRKVAGYDDIVDQSQDNGGENYSYANNPRAIIFANYQDKVIDIETMKYIMQMNLYQGVEVKRRLNNKQGFINKLFFQNNPGHQIASRFDLVKGMQRNVGAIDAKIVDVHMAIKNQQWAISGPSYQEMPVFVWSKAKNYDQHFGHPDVWNFQWTIIDPINMMMIKSNQKY